MFIVVSAGLLAPFSSEASIISNTHRWRTCQYSIGMSPQILASVVMVFIAALANGGCAMRQGQPWRFLGKETLAFELLVLCAGAIARLNGDATIFGGFLLGAGSAAVIALKNLPADDTGCQQGSDA